MLKKIVELALKERIVVYFATVLLIVAGIYSFTQLPIDASSRSDEYACADRHAMAGTQHRGGRKIRYHPDRDGDEWYSASHLASLDDALRSFDRLSNI